MNTKRIYWNGFLEHAVKEYPKKQLNINQATL